MKDVNIKVNVDTGGAESEINKLDNSLEGLGNTSTTASSKVGKLDNTVKKSRSGMDNLSKSAKKATAAEAQMGNAAATASTKVGKLANTTGQANNAVVEMGRVASDAQYGLRGMGNNISQLATQIFQLMATEDQSTQVRKKNVAVTNLSSISTKNAAASSKTATAAIAAQSVVTEVATKKTLGFVGAVKTIGSAMAGPLGLLFLLQGVITAVTWYFTTVDEAAESTDEFADSMTELNKQINDNYLSQEELNLAIGAFIARSYEMKAVTEEQKIVNEEAAAAFALHAEKVQLVKDLQERLLTQKVNVIKFQKMETQATTDAANAMILYVALIEESNRLEGERKRIKEEANAANVGSLKALEKQLSEQKKEQKNNSTNAIEFKKYGEKIAATQAEIDEITGKDTKKPKDTSERDKAAIDKEINAHLDKHKTLQKAEIDASNRKYDKLAEDAEKYGYKTEEIERARIHAITEITEEYSLLEHEKEIERNQRKNDLALNQKQWEDDNIETPYAKYLAQAETIELEMEQLETKYIAEQELYKDDKDKLLELEADYLDSSQALKQEAADLTTNRKKQLADDELEIQTAYEEAVVELREASFGAAEEGFGLLARLSGENKKLQAVAIVGENAVAVVKTIVDTIATNKVLSSTATTETAKALASAASYDFAASAMHTTAAATATTGIATNNIAAGTAIAASVGAAATGLAALGESGNLTSGAAPTDSGGVQAPPTFNLVQGSEGNQIQNSIQSAGDVPVRAFVVAQDVTSQQSLDRQIESNSGI